MKTKSHAFSLRIFLTLLFGWFLQPALGQVTTAPGVWQTNGPQFNAEVTGIMADLQTNLLLHLGTRGPGANIATGLFRSTDGGVSWVLADEQQLNDVNVMTLFEVNDILFVSVVNFDHSDDSGLYYSWDKGESWHRAEGGMADKTALAIASNGEALFAGGLKLAFNEDIIEDAFGLFTSTDDGRSWQAIPAMEGRIVTSLAVSASKIYAGTGGTLPNRGAFLANEPQEHGVFISEDGGENWTYSLPGNRIESMLFYRDTIIAGTQANGLFYTSDQNIAWTNAVRTDGVPLNLGSVRNLTTIFPDSLLALSLQDGDQRDEVYTSINGEAWNRLNQTESPITKLISDLHPDTPYLFVGTESDGVIRVVDIDKTDGLNNAAWVPAEPPIAGTHITAFAANAGGEDTYAGTLVNGLFRAPTGAPVWFPTSPQPTHIATGGVNVSNERMLLAYGAGAGVYRSLDGGQSWTPAVTPFTAPISSLIYHFDQDWFLLGSEYPDSQDRAIGIWRSRDGLQWEQTGVDSVLVYQLLESQDEETIYAATDKGIYRTKGGNSGGDWERILEINSGEVLVMMEVENDGFWAGARFGAAGLYFSADGNTWNLVEGELARKTVTALAYFDENVYVGTDGEGIYFSADGLTNWQKANVPFRDEQGSRISQFQVIGNDDLLLAGSGGLPGITSDDQGLFYSADGADWFAVDEESIDHVRMDDKDIWKIIALDSVAYVATDGHGVFRSEKFDLSQWFPLNTGLTDLNTRNIIHMPGTKQLVLSTFEGVFTQKLDVINPKLEYFDVGGGKRFENPDYTNSRDVRFFIFAFDPLADGSDRAPDFMRVSETPDFSDTTWIAYNDNIDFTEPNFTIKSGGEGVKTIYAQVRDHSWNLSEVLSWDITLDQTKPQFDSHTPPSGAKVGQPVTVSFSVTEPNIESITFRLRRPGQQWDPRRSFTFFEDTDGASDIEVPGEFISNSGFDYRIIVADRAGNVDSLRSNALDFVSLPVNLNEGELGNSNSLPAGTGAGSYRMVSAPMNLQNSPPAKVLFKDLGDYGRRGKWRFYAYQGNGQWQEGESIPLQTGAGYFMIRRDGGPLTNKMAGDTAPTSDGVTGKIRGWQLRANDWTLIGNPYNTRLTLGQLMFRSDSTRLNDEAVAGQIWLYDGNWKNPQTAPDLALEAWSGLFVRAAQADTIIFSNANDPFKPVGKVSVPPGDLIEPVLSASVHLLSSEKKATDEIMKMQLPDLFAVNQDDKVRTQKQKSHRKENARMQFSKPANALAENRVTQNSSTNSSLGETIAIAKPTDFLATLGENEWLVQIIATSREASDEVNYFGVRKEAKEALDKHDWFKPPFLLAGVNLTFPHADWDTPVELAADVRPVAGEGHRWEIAVKGEPTHAVQLNFANLESVPENQHILLLDETSKIIYDLRQESALAVRIPDAGVKNLVILAGSDFFINKHTEGMLGVPTSFALHQNYPNPFNPSTTIRYQLPVAGRVTLKVFDMMGRQVLVLEENKSREPGYYELVTDMKSLGSGVYFYRLDITGEQKFQATKKMLYIK
ncbi:T9SS type A sorting domain-containing protein [candidate division KSB1 bacterium]|nr:T9SS type A sorting domain-containing protein [bacterium]NUM68013.1 T9SS type A sorting domain-containing protein [candidate division KSB1 bacterium]